MNADTPNCYKCKSKTHISSTYPDMWFCPSCGAGDYLTKKPSSIRAERKLKPYIFDFNNSKEEFLKKSFEERKKIIEEIQDHPDIDPDDLFLY